MEQYFAVEMVSDSAKVCIMILHLEGRAQGGIEQLVWSYYLQVIRDRFVLEEFDDPKF